MKLEAAVQQEARLVASELGWRVWRNNVGAAQDQTGRYIRYGLANESREMNRRLKSSDLIGIRPRIITPEDVGKTIGQFVSLEVKHGGWMKPTNDREAAQARWLKLINTLGGYGRFISDAGQIGY